MSDLTKVLIGVVLVIILIILNIWSIVDLAGLEALSWKEVVILSGLAIPIEIVMIWAGWAFVEEVISDSISGIVIAFKRQTKSTDVKKDILLCLSAPSGFALGLASGILINTRLESIPIAILGTLVISVEAMLVIAVVVAMILSIFFN